MPFPISPRFFSVVLRCLQVGHKLSYELVDYAIVCLLPPQQTPAGGVVVFLQPTEGNLQGLEHRLFDTDPHKYSDYPFRVRVRVRVRVSYNQMDLVDVLIHGISNILIPFMNVNISRSSIWLAGVGTGINRQT